MWKKIALILFAALAGAPPAPAFASSQTELSFITKTEDPVLNEVLAQTHELLPPNLRRSLPWTIEVSWGEVSRFQPILWKDCSHPSLQTENLVTLDDVKYYAGKRLQARKFRLNPALRDGVLENIRSCRHRHALGLAQGAIIQRLARIFDQIGRPRPLSNSAQYLALSGFYPWGNSFRSIYKNQNLRHHDPREWSEPSSHFASNLEHLLLDPSWECHRPAIAEYFRGLFPEREASACLLEIQKTLKDEESVYETIDPARVYQIRLQTVAPGKTLVSSWGHSMLRVVICAPTRSRVGPECLNDIDHHLILSFYADTGGKPQTVWEGVNGSFNAKLYIYPYRSMADSYTRTEKRAIDETPLRLSGAEMRLLVAGAAEMNRYYTGRWFDLTWNCVSQLFGLLRSAVAEERLDRVQFTSPQGLVRALGNSSDLLGPIDSMPEEESEYPSPGRPHSPAASGQ